MTGKGAVPPAGNNTRGASKNGTPKTIPSRHDISSLFAGTATSIASIADAKRYFETNGWILEGEEYLKQKIINVIHTVALNSKIPADVATVLKAIGYLLQDEVNDNIADEVVSAITTKLEATLAPSITAIKESASFLEAASKTQAEATLALKALAEKQTVTLDTAAEKLAGFPLTRGIHTSADDTPSWARVAAVGHTSINPAPNTMAFASNITDISLQQRILLAACTIMVTRPPSTIPSQLDRSPAKAKEYRSKLTDAITQLDLSDLDTEEEQSIRKISIKGVQILPRGDILLEFSTASMVPLFRRINKEYDLTMCIAPDATIKDRMYPVILKFVPCNGSFSPSDREHLDDLETNTGLDSGSIVSAAWIKPPHARAAKQTVANLKVLCATTEAANRLLTERIYIDGHLVKAHKDLREPIRCGNCQLYGHIRANCLDDAVCSRCTSNDHTHENCTSDNQPQCISCGPNSTHPSSSRNCPVFLRKCKELDARCPENNMPYFPTNERWTWAATPARPPSTPQSPPPQRSVLRNTRRSGNLDQTQQGRDSGWLGRGQRQTTLNELLTQSQPNNAGPTPSPFDTSAPSQ
jgi:hypothetical protein